MNFGGNNFDSGMKSMRSPASGRGNSQALVFRGQQSPGQHDHHQQQQQQQRQHNNSGGGTGGHTPNSRYNTPSKGLPKSSYLQRRTPGATPGTSERTPGTGGTTPYNANNSSSRMSTGFQSSPGSGLTTPGRRGGGRLSLLGSDSRSQYSYQQDYSKMDETLTGGGGDLFNRDSVDQDDYNHHDHSANYHNASTPRGGYTSTDLGMRQRRGLSTPSGNTSSEGAVMDSQSATNSLHPHWVIVFGLPAHAPDDSPCSTTNVLKLFQGYGEIDNYHTSPGNWLLIKFSSSLDANNAAGVLHRTFLTSEVMIGVESLTPSLAKKLNLTFQVDGQLVITPGKPKKQFSRVEQQGKAQGALLDPDYDNIMRPPRKVTKDICTRIFEFFMY